MEELNKQPKPDQDKTKLNEANFCIGLGVGVGAVGFGVGAVAGAICPLCYVVPPILVGVGLVKRHQAKKQ